MGRTRNPGTPAQGAIRLAVNPSAAETFTIGTTVYTWVVAATAAREITIGGSAAASVVNAIAEGNANPPVPTGVEFFADPLDTLTIRLAADLAGTGGNLALAETMGGGGNIVSGAFMTDGEEKNLRDEQIVEYTVLPIDVSSGGTVIRTRVQAMSLNWLNVRTAAGVLKSITDIVTINATDLRIDIDGATNIVATDIVRFQVSSIANPSN